MVKLDYNQASKAGLPDLGYKCCDGIVCSCENRQVVVLGTFPINFDLYKGWFKNKDCYRCMECISYLQPS